MDDVQAESPDGNFFLRARDAERPRRIPYRHQILTGLVLVQLSVGENPKLVFKACIQKSRKVL